MSSRKQRAAYQDRKRETRRGADRGRPPQTDAEREAAEAAFADLLARQRDSRDEDTE